MWGEVGAGGCDRQLAAAGVVGGFWTDVRGKQRRSSGGRVALAGGAHIWGVS